MHTRSSLLNSIPIRIKLKALKKPLIRYQTPTRHSRMQTKEQVTIVMVRKKIWCRSEQTDNVHMLKEKQRNSTILMTSSCSSLEECTIQISECRDVDSTFNKEHNHKNKDSESTLSHSFCLLFSLCRSYLVFSRLSHTSASKWATSTSIKGKLHSWKHYFLLAKAISNTWIIDLIISRKSIGRLTKHTSVESIKIAKTKKCWKEDMFNYLRQACTIDKHMHNKPPRSTCQAAIASTFYNRTMRNIFKVCFDFVYYYEVAWRNR